MNFTGTALSEVCTRTAVVTYFLTAGHPFHLAWVLWTNVAITQNILKETRMVQLPATAAIEYVATCCKTRTRTRTKTKIGTITKTVRGAYARSPQVQCVYAPSRLSVPSIVA